MCFFRFTSLSYRQIQHSSTYIMGQNADFNLQLNDTRRRFTYFVPRDWAWQQTQTEFPSTHKKLFMPEFYYHVSENILKWQKKNEFFVIDLR